jgi:hypothetical protein
MERITPSKTGKAAMNPCGKTECAHCQEKTELRKAPSAENKDAIAANIFRKYYEALLQGYSIDFFQTKHGQGSFHCT